MNRINVINVISDSNIGGAGRMLITFLEHTYREMFHITVVLPTGSKLIPELERVHAPFVEMDGIADRSFDIRSNGRFLRLFRRLKPDIVHTHGSLSARIAAKRAGARVVYTRHSVFDLTKKQKTFPARLLTRYVNNRFADIIIAVSPAAGDNLTQLGTNPDKIVVVYNGTTRLNKERVTGGAFTCAILARLEPEKGHGYIWETAEELIRRGETDIKIIAAGTGTLERELAASAPRNVEMPGFVTDTAALLARTDVQLNASVGTEATSLSLLEGMSIGVPAVVSDFGGNVYVIKDGVNGLVVPQRDPIAMADAIVNIKNDDVLRERLSNGALRTFDETFTAEKMTKGIESVYLKVLEGRSGRT